jgi:hypothetical protein
MKREDPVQLGDMVAAGPRAVSRYTGTLLAVFVVQSLVAAACMVGVAAVLAQVFAHQPLFDDAVDGDLVAMIVALRGARSAFVASAGIVIATVLLWQLVSWFVIGGLNGVIAQRPDGRGETARTFGASGASTYLAYAKIALWSLPGWMLVSFVFGTLVNAIIPRLEHALTLLDLIGPLALVVVPTCLLLHVVWTVADYARLELTLWRDSHDPTVGGAYLRAIAFVVRRPVALVHGAIGWLVFLAITIGYGYLAKGRSMYGAEGALTLFVIRTGVSLLRMAVKVGVLGGQVELARSRPPPPRRVDTIAAGA